MFAIGRLRCGGGAGGSWLLVCGEWCGCPARLVVAALALGNTIGQTVVAIPLVLVTRRICGPAAVRGVGHAAVAGLAAGAAGAAVGMAVSLAVPLTGRLLAVGLAVLAASGAVIAFGVVAFLLDAGDARSLLARLRRLARRRP